MSDDSDVDKDGYDSLLRNINFGKNKTAQVRKSLHAIDVKDLLDSVKIQKKSVARAKLKVANDIKNKSSKSSSAIPAPLHRQERERLQGEVGFMELKKDLHVWKDIVDSNRLADQMSFPLHQEDVLLNDNATNKADTFRPKTDFERELAELVQTSKHNLNNDVVYTEAELEILKAMDLKEAKERLNRLQRNRALISYKEAKNRYQKRIKSKGYHRLLKRQKRKQLVKEFDELLVRDPDAAREKLKQLETDRVLERGTLKHNAKSQFRMSVLKRAGKDPIAKKILEEHMRMGKELREKISMESEDDSDDEDEDEEGEKKQKSVAELIKSAALAAAQEDTTQSLEFDEEGEPGKRLKLFELRAQKRAKIAKMKADGTIEKVEENVFEENADWTAEDAAAESTSAPTTADEGSKKKKATKKRKQKKNEEKPEESVVESPETNSKAKGNVETVDEIFENAGEAILKKLRSKMGKDEPAEETPTPAKKKKTVREKEPVKEAEPDITLDPKHFLKLETSNLSKVAADFDDQVTELEDEQSQLIAEAFKDEDVIGEFEEEKERAEQKEKPEDIDLTLQGWGSWAGPGTTERKQRKFIIKAAEKKRKDRGKSAVIIKEKPDMPIHRLQPRDLPFPYLDVEDFQKAISQPLGKDYNPVTVTKDLCKPAVVTQAGRSIRPMDKEEAIKKKLIEDKTKIPF